MFVWKTKNNEISVFSNTRFGVWSFVFIFMRNVVIQFENNIKFYVWDASNCTSGMSTGVAKRSRTQQKMPKLFPKPSHTVNENRTSITTNSSSVLTEMGRFEEIRVRKD